MPKALLPVVGRPFAEHQIELLAANGIEDMVFAVAYRGEMIRDALGDGRRLGVTIRYVDEGEDRRGTGGAVRLFVDSGMADERFGVLYGDSYLPIDYSAVWGAYDDRGLPALMTVLHNHDRWDTSNAALDAEGRVSYRKGAGAHATLTYIDYGLSVLSAEIVSERVPPETVNDLAGLFEELGDRGMLAGFEVHERFYEVGSAEGAAALEHLLTCRSEAQ
jgi:NDP-sugar pyrophosphorylase family protein